MTDPAHVVHAAPGVDERAASYDQVAAHSTVPHFLPLLAERLARQRLTALAAG